MVSTFVNPTVNPDSGLGVRVFDETESVCLRPYASGAEVEIVIQAIYRQILGNAYVMESERLSTLESQLIQGNLSVCEFVRQLAKSALYRTRFFESGPRYRAIELNFKHLLGRAPESYEETAHHSHLLDSGGYDAEIDSYIDSDEYQEAFGTDTVPYYRGYKTQTGKSLVGFTHMSKLLRGRSASDKDYLSQRNSARLARAILTNQASQITPTTNISRDWSPFPDTKQIIAAAVKVSAASFGLNSGPWVSPVSLAATTAPPVAVTPAAIATDAFASAADSYQQNRYQGLQALNREPVELCSGFSAADADVVIRAVYCQVLGNAYVMESERLEVPESQLKRGELSVRELIRCIAKSALYRTRFFDNCYRYRSIELNFKHLLGRAPTSFEEMKFHSTLLDEAGFEADIDSYLDSDEYQQAFGEAIVPYYRGINTQAGQPVVGFANTLQLLRSASSSDQNPAAGNPPQLLAALMATYPHAISQPRDAKDILREVFKPKTLDGNDSQVLAEKVAAERALQQTLEKQAQQIVVLEQQLADIRPVAMLGAMQIKDSWSPLPLAEPVAAAAPLQQQVDWQASKIAALQAQIAAARRYAAIGESRLSKWRNRLLQR